MPSPPKTPIFSYLEGSDAETHTKKRSLDPCRFRSCTADQVWEGLGVGQLLWLFRRITGLCPRRENILYGCNLPFLGIWANPCWLVGKGTMQDTALCSVSPSL